MEDEILLNRPTDRRLVAEDNDLPPGPPGAENDTFELVRSEPKPPKEDPPEPRPRTPSKSRDRRSRSKSRDRRRSRSRGRNYSPPPARRRYGGNNRGNRRSTDRNRRSPDRIRHRSRDRRRNRRDRSRSRGRYRRRSRTSSPRSRHWSPDMKKPASPPPLSPVLQMNQPYSVPPPNAYADGYGTYANQYVRPQFPGYEYVAPVAPAPPQFTNAYPPAPAAVLPQPIPPGDDFTTNPWIHGTAAVAPAAVAETLPPAMHQPVVPVPAEDDEDKLKRDAAVAQEVRNQRSELKKQRDEYLKRANALKRELKMLKEQRNDLLSVPTSPTTKGFLKENDRLQSQIQHKLLTMENVIDMLCGIIGEDSPPSPKKSSKKKKSETENDDSSPERLKTKLIESMKNKPNKKDSGKPTSPKMKTKDDFATKYDEPTKHVNYVFYDHEMHWCATCNEFPKTAKDYLNHLHSKDHADKVEVPEIPWHDDIVNDEIPSYANAPTKRTPIRGLQFFVPSTCWYCKLCKFWMGDLHCASAHLKSQTHSEKYNQFTEQNPHFEVDWMADRQKAYDTEREKDTLPPPPPPQITSVSTTGIDLLEGIPLQINRKSVESEDKKSKRKKKKSDEKKEKKKKKRSKRRKKQSSSSSSSSSDTTSESESEKEKKLLASAQQNDDRSNSIRVAMRNILKSQQQQQQQQQKDLKSPKEEINHRGKWTCIQDKSTTVVAGNDGHVVDPTQQHLQQQQQSQLQSMPTQASTKGNDSEQRKRDDLMLLQWNVPQPIISESEKKLLEELKGKLKNKPSADATNKHDAPRESQSSSGKNDKNSVKMSSKTRRDTSPKNYDGKEKMRRTSRSRSRNRRSVTPTRNRLPAGRRSRSPVRSRSRERRSRSRGRVTSPLRRRRRSRSRSPRRRSRSPSRSRRRRSYSRSRSRSRSHRIEKPIVRYPEFRPRVPENQRENKKNNKPKVEEENDRKKSPTSKKSQSNQTSSSGQGKKLPFIGRMPVFKKQCQGGENDKKEGEMGDDGMLDHMHMGYDQYDTMNAMMDYEDLMPDPMQFVSLMGAPPPPPSAPPPMSKHEEDKDILPPGIDEAEADLVPKPISDAPRPRKGPLPKDFEEALNIIFPGEKKAGDDDAAGGEREKQNLKNQQSSVPPPPEPIKPEAVPPPLPPSVPPVPVPASVSVSSSALGDDGSSIEIPPLPPTPDEVSQQSNENFIAFAPVPPPPSTKAAPAEVEVTNGTTNKTATLPAFAPPPPPPETKPDEEEKPTLNGSNKDKPEDEKPSSPVAPSKPDPRKEMLDDLAMLGIDADDLAAQCI